MRFFNTVAARLQNVIFAAGDADVSLGDRASNMWQAAYDEEGQTLVEYALIIAVFAAVVTVAVFSLGSMISMSFQQTQNCIATRQSAPDCSPGPLEGQ